MNWTINIGIYFIPFLMFSKKSTVCFYYLILFSVVAFSQPAGQVFIDVFDLQRHMEFLASDSLMGRNFNTKTDGLGIASDYLKKSVESMGLKPGGQCFFQPVDLISVKPNNDETFLEVSGINGKPAWVNHSLIKLEGSDGNFEFENDKIVFAGFGWKNDSMNFEFPGLDLAGKVVLLAEGKPDYFSKQGFSKREQKVEELKYQALAGKKVKAVIVISLSKDFKNSIFNRMENRLTHQRYNLKNRLDPTAGVPVFMTTPDFPDALLGGKGKYRKYLSSVAKEKHTGLVPIENMKWKGKFSEEVIDLFGRNVVGIVEGSDPELKTECVVFMAHYDHLGIGKEKDVMNGADDNVSGTAALLEIAEAFSKLEEKPRRSIVFLWVTAEEFGMFGSKYYVDHPAFPMDKTLACINLDMVGRVYEPRDSVWDHSPKRVKDFDGLYTLTNNICPGLAVISDSVCGNLGLVPDHSLPESFLYNSDHYHFHKNQVPVLAISTGYHADYHKSTDETSKISFSKLKRVADYVFWVGYAVANQIKSAEMDAPLPAGRN